MVADRFYGTDDDFDPSDDANLIWSLVRPGGVAAIAALDRISRRTAREARQEAVAEPPGIAATRAGLIRALERWRWCWDCGTRDEECRANRRPCCPDCRHRDTGNLALGKVLAVPGEGVR